MGKRLMARPTSAVLALALAAAPPLAAACCPPRVGEQETWPMSGAGDFEENWLGTDALGGVYAIFGDGREQTYVRVSRDDGTTWQDVSAPVSSGRVTLVGAAVDEAGTLVLVHVSGSRVLASYGSDQARSFSTPVLLADNSPHAPTRPRVALGPGGLTVAAWLVLQESGSTGDGVWAAVSPDRGRTWSTARRIDEGPGSWSEFDVEGVSLTVAATGRTAAVAWIDARTGAAAAWLDRSADGGATWAADVRVDTAMDPATPQGVGLAATPDGAFQVAYSACSFTLSLPTHCIGQAEYRVNVSTDEGLSWLAEDTVIGTGILAIQPSILARPDGRVFVAWGSREPGEGTSNQALMNASSDRGLPGTWHPAMSRFGSGALMPHHFRIAECPPGFVNIVHDDYRDMVVIDGQIAESIYMDRSCDEGLTWLVPEPRLDDDAPPEKIHSEDPSIAASVSGRVHVMWVDTQYPSSNPSNVQYRGLDTGPDVLPVTVTPGTTCTRATYRLEVVAGSFGACADPRYQWYQDGVAVPGATGETYDVPGDLPAGVHVFHYVVTCSTPLSCGDTSRAVFLDIAAISTTVVDFDLGPTLRVSKRGSGLRLSWSDTRPEAVGYAAYAGTIDSLFTGRRHDHAALRCAIVRTPPGASTTRLDTAMPSVDTYYLVSPAGCLGEGGLGADSFGTRRPVPGLGAPCGPVP
jgi:hypothetical protein